MMNSYDKNFISNDFENKRIIVTGASSGIGKKISIELSRLGATVVLIGRNKERLADTLREMHMPDEHEIVEFDLHNTEGIPGMFDSLCKNKKPFSGLVYSAGISPILPLRMIDYKALDSTMRINYYSFVEMVKQFSSSKYKNSGSIVGISSTASSMGEKGQIVYASSKGAMDSAIVCMAQELSSKGIRINNIRPGLILTEMTERFASKSGSDFMKKQEGKQILGLGKPHYISNFAIFLLSELSAFCTGRSYYVDGGRFQ